MVTHSIAEVGEEGKTNCAGGSATAGQPLGGLVRLYDAFTGAPLPVLN